MNKPTGCRCQQPEPHIIDTTECPIHPLTCDAIHPQTGIGCHHEPHHPGRHGYLIGETWANNP